MSKLLTTVLIADHNKILETMRALNGGILPNDPRIFLELKRRTIEFLEKMM